MPIKILCIPDKKKKISVKEAQIVKLLSSVSQKARH